MLDRRLTWCDSFWFFVLFSATVLLLNHSVVLADSPFEANPSQATVSDNPLPEKTSSPAILPVNNSPVVAKKDIANTTNTPPVSPSPADQVGPFDVYGKKKVGERNPSLQSENSLQSKSSQQERSDPLSLGRVFVALLVVLGVIAAVAYGFRRFVLRSKAFGTGSVIKILARNSVTPRQSLCLVELGERLMLIGLSPNHIARLDVIDDPEEIARIMGRLEAGAGQSISNTFNNIFRRESREYDAIGNYYPDDNSDQDSDQDNRQWYNARGELSSLLDKVKGLTRIGLRSRPK